MEAAGWGKCLQKIYICLERPPTGAQAGGGRFFLTAYLYGIFAPIRILRAYAHIFPILGVISNSGEIVKILTQFTKTS
jgi:hypothetical protein